MIDINGATPVVSDAASMPLPLHWHNATVIADGRVVVTGGSAKSNLLTGASKKALIWDPVTGVWVSGATGSGRTRLYHSMALLLPDASVLVGGGGAPGPEANANAEIYYPPYLFQASGGFAVRPKIKAAPKRLIYGKRFALTVDRPGAIKAVTLVKAGSVTHSLNMEQRFQKLPFTIVDGKLSMQAPVSGGAGATRHLPAVHPRRPRRALAGAHRLAVATARPQAAAASACSRSAMMSSAVSMPIDSRTTSGPAPAATSCVLVELAVGGRGGVDDQRAGVADVGDVAEQLAVVDQAHAHLVAALDADGEHRAQAARAVLLQQRRAVLRQAGVGDPG